MVDLFIKKTVAALQSVLSPCAARCVDQRTVYIYILVFRIRSEIKLIVMTQLSGVLSSLSRAQYNVGSGLESQVTLRLEKCDQFSHGDDVLNRIVNHRAHVT